MTDWTACDSAIYMQELLQQVATILDRPKMAFAHLGVDIDLFASRAQLSIAAKVFSRVLSYLSHLQVEAMQPK